MEPKAEIAIEKFKKGYNCCQAVICSYCSELGMSETEVFKLTEGFELGMGGLKDTCGAVTGMFMTISFANSAGDIKNPRTTKLDTYEKIRELADTFQQKNGSIYCRDLKSTDGAQPLRSCIQCVENAARLTDAYFEQNQVEYGQSK